MPHIFDHAAAKPNWPAVIVAETGEQFSFAQLEAQSNQIAHLWRRHGLKGGDKVAFVLPNIPIFFALAWAAQRSGLDYVCVSPKLTKDEAAYILHDSGARLVVADAGLADTVSNLPIAGLIRQSVCGSIKGFELLEASLAAQPSYPIGDQSLGMPMLYSSGTTGRPKGVVKSAGTANLIDEPTPLMMLAQGYFGLSSETVYLCPAPLYHSAPLNWTMAVQQMGGTIVLMRKFDPAVALESIQRYRCSAAQFVPTHFIRMLKLPQAVRSSFDVSSLRTAIHAAAPCPVPVKEAMIDWWGPIIDEYYAGTEGNGVTAIKSAEWLQRKGSVGRILAGTAIHICDEGGTPLPPGTEGIVYFEGPSTFSYHNDPLKTAESRSKQGWTTLGDIGWVDEDGYLYLTDRKSFMIISGGVNIYPQEIENHLVTHASVQDVAVIGGPNADLGEEVIAVIELVPGVKPSDELRDDIQRYAREKLSGLKIPRRVDFVETLPRHETGKLYKRLLRDAYWAKVRQDG